MSKSSSRRFVVRVTLSDGSVLKDGGYQTFESARAHAARWMSEGVSLSRKQNAALAVKEAHAESPYDPPAMVGRPAGYEPPEEGE